MNTTIASVTFKICNTSEFLETDELKQTLFFVSDPCLDEVQEWQAKVLTPGRRSGLVMSDSDLEEEQVRVITIA